MKSNEGYWEEDWTAKMGLRCKFHPKCYFCGARLRLFDTGLLDFPLDENKPEKRSHAVDCNFMCPECGWRSIFGVAVSKKHWGRLLKMLEKMAKDSEAKYLFDKDKKDYFLKSSNVADGIETAKTPLWKRTNDADAHKPLFDVKCFYCSNEMIMRHSTLQYHDDDTNLNELHRAAYKCPFCGWFVIFNVVDEKNYLKKVHEEYRKE